MPVTLGLAQPLEAKGTFTILPAGTSAYSINDNGVVVGTEGPGAGFVRTPDGTITQFKAADDAVFTIPLCINNSGVVTGYYQESDGKDHGFVRDADGVITSFDVPVAAPIIYPAGINAAGVVAGTYDDQLGNAHGFVRATDGSVTTIDVRNAKQTWVSTINTKGEIAGYWADGFGHGFVRTVRGKIKSFDVPGATGVVNANAINDAGTVTGSYTNQENKPHGFIRQRDGAFTTFDVGAGTWTIPVAINARGTVAGYDNVSARYHFQGFIRYRNGRVKRIKASDDKQSTYVFGMNNNNVVVGAFPERSGTSHGFIWTP